MTPFGADWGLLRAIDPDGNLRVEFVDGPQLLISDRIALDERGRLLDV
jgi:hypothetical protein